MAPTALVASIAVFAVVAVATDEAILGFVSGYSVVGYIAIKTGDSVALGLFVLLTLIAALSVASQASDLLIGRSGGA